MTAACTCRPPYLHIDHVPRQVRCSAHWFQVPPIDVTAPKAPQPGGQR